MKNIIFNLDSNYETFTKNLCASLPLNKFNLGEISVKKFADGEQDIKFLKSVRGCRVYLVCPTENSDNIVLSLLAIDAAKRASAKEVVLITPYYGYCRQDKKDGRSAIGAMVMARSYLAQGLDRIITFDLHSEQIEGYFPLIDHIHGTEIIANSLLKELEEYKHEKIMLVSPDGGGTKRVEKIYKKLAPHYSQLTMTSLSKHRATANAVESITCFVDVNDYHIVIIDDMVDTAGTLCKAADMLKEKGGKTITAVCSHAILSGDAIAKIYNSCFDKFVVTTSRNNKRLLNSFTANKTKIVELSIEPVISKLMLAIDKKVSADKFLHND